MKRSVFTLVSVALGAWAASWAMSAGLADLDAPPEAPASVQSADVADKDGPPRAADARREPARPRSAYVDPIVQRSIFDSSRVGGAPEREFSDEPTLTELDVVLLATVVTDPPDYSSALIGRETTRRVRRKKGKRRRTVRVRSVEDSAGYGIGDTLKENATITAIEQERVTIRRDDGRVEYLMLWSDEDEDDEAVPAQGEAPKVKRLAKDRYSVPADLLAKVAGGPAEWSKLGRAALHKGSNGEVDGFRLSRISSGSLGRDIGLRSGDVVHEINGSKLKSVGAALEALPELADSSSITIEFTRRKKLRTLQVDVR